MNKLPSPLTEIVLGVVLLILLTVIFNPYDLYMTQMTTMLIALSFLILFGIFALFALREQPRDEREELLIIKTSRFAFLITGAVLALGIAIELIQHDIDPWLLIVFAVMIFSKLFGYIYQHKNG
jgi:O-antigen/teichoic acid export membrane protein